jgi:hypothetical protein
MNTDLGFHSYKIFSNTIQEWDLFDSKERYEENLNKNFNLLKSNNWIDKKITYKFNGDGFRSFEFDADTDSILFLGCSLTFGTGLPLEETAGYLISQKLKLRFFNLGLGGTSNDTAFRFGYHYISTLKPKIVIMFSPENSRIELCENQKIFYYRSQMKFYQMDSFYKKWLLDDTNSFLNQQKNILAIENICITNNIKFLCFDAPKLFLIDFKVTNDFARDLIHPGIKTHQLVSEFVLGQI